MAKINVQLQPSEAVVARCAATIYAGYVMAGKVVPNQENTAMKKAVEEAIFIARAVDESVTSDGEMG
jgi:hypothetical protein